MAVKTLNGGGSGSKPRQRRAYNGPKQVKSKVAGQEQEVKQEAEQVQAQEKEQSPELTQADIDRLQGMDHKDRKTIMYDSPEAMSDAVVGYAGTDREGKPSLDPEKDRARIAEMLLDPEKRGQPHGVVTGHGIDKDGNYVACKDPKTGTVAGAVRTIMAPTDDQKLEDVSDDYIDAIRDSEEYKKAVEQLKAMFGKQRQQPWNEGVGWGDPEAVGSKENPDEALDRFHEHYGEFYGKLAGLHLQGGYQKEIDSTQPVFEARDSVRAQLAKEDPEMERAMVNKARHWLNVQDQMMKSGCDFRDCTFVDANGKVMQAPGADASQEEYQRYTDAMVYAMDHGMLSEVRGKDGKAIEGLPVKDEYTANLQFYDDNAQRIEEHRLKLDQRAAAVCETQAEAHKGDQGHPEIGGCKITGVTNEQYHQDVQERAKAYEAETQERVDMYKSGKNPMLEQLKAMGMSDQALSKSPDYQAEGQEQSTAQRSAAAQAIINQARGYADNVHQSEDEKQIEHE